ncbi:threonine/serine exporter family protein [Secundilactobacillus sp. HBUAS58055]|nr:threonine/serine exporter family protein [Secundilactobacillus angelensis]MCH5461585.1 threonine/serine exporter family protein [Secundilactobacillus angelensis]
MAIPWKEFAPNQSLPIKEARVKARASIVGRIGIMMLSCGTGAWRVRDAMNTIARVLDLTCSADIGLTSISYTCFDANHSYSQILALPNTGVNTDRLFVLETFVKQFEAKYAQLTVLQLHHTLDEIQQTPGNYSPIIKGLAAAIACASFIFLLGGGWIEMFCTFIGAGVGNWVRGEMGKRKMTTISSIAVSVALAELTYFLTFKGLQFMIPIAGNHEAGYIGAMLFVIPGFPFITSFLDLSKLDMRSGLERLSYAIMITSVATLVGWLIALFINFQPENFISLGLTPLMLLLLRLPASFFGVYGFSMMFNSSQKMAITSGLIGAVANTLRLELVDFHTMPAPAAAFCGALVAGLLASIINRTNGYPRISLTVPSIVIMIPGLYIYRGIFYIGLNEIANGGLWLTRAALIIIFLPLGLFVARYLLDKDWRHFD